MPSIERILVPTDFSPSSHAALGYAVFLASRLGAAVEVLAVYESVASVGPETQVVVPGVGARALSAVLHDRAREQLARFVTDVPGLRGEALATRLEPGDPAQVILRIADEERFDLVVMGTHGRTGLSRLMMGSVTEKVVRGALCPVLTVRVPGA